MNFNKFYLKLFLYSLIICLTAWHSHVNYNLLHQHIFRESINIVLYTQYLLNFIVGLIMVLLEFMIVQTDRNFISELETKLNRH